MKIAVVLSHSLMGSPGTTVRVRELGLSIQRMGVQIELLSPYIDKGHAWGFIETIPLSDVEQPFLREILYNITRYAYYAHWFFHDFYSNKLIREITSNNLAQKIIRTYKKRIPPDIILAVCPPDINISVCLKVARELHIPVVVDLQNVANEELITSGVLAHNSKTFSKLQSLTTRMLATVDHIFVVSDLMKEYVHNEFKISLDRISVIPPGGRLRPRSTKFINPSVIYSGLLAKREHVDLFIKSMPIIKKRKPETRFFLSKIGEEYTNLRKMARKFDVFPTFFWYPNEQDFYQFLSSCHVAVLPSTNDLPRKMGTPLKLFDYMSVGLPVVTNDIGSWSTIVSREKIGLVTEDDPKSFAHAIIGLLNDPILATSFGERGRELVKTKYSWDNSGEKLFEILKRVKNDYSSKQ